MVQQLRRAVQHLVRRDHLAGESKVLASQHHQNAPRRCRRLIHLHSMQNRHNREIVDPVKSIMKTISLKALEKGARVTGNPRSAHSPKRAANKSSIRFSISGGLPHFFKDKTYSKGPVVLYFSKFPNVVYERGLRDVEKSRCLSKLHWGFNSDNRIDCLVDGDLV